MSSTHLTPAQIERTVYVVDTSGILDLVCPARLPGQVGRIGNLRLNTRLLLIGVLLCTRLGHETTVRGVLEVLTTAIPREVQWGLGVLRPATTTAKTDDKTYDPDQPTLTRRGKPRKRRWGADHVEEVSYDDLHHATVAIRRRLDYGHGSAPDLDENSRDQRHAVINEFTQALADATSIPRTGSAFAIDATGQWAWSRGPESTRKRLQRALDADEKRKAQGDTGSPSNDEAETLEIADILVEDDDESAQPVQTGEVPAAAQGKCLDAAWGYKTSKHGGKEAGFGFHQHTIVRVPDPNADEDSEPVLVDGFTITPANADPVAESLALIDRIRVRPLFTLLAGDLLYTNLRAERWAVPLAHRGIEQCISMRSDNHGLLDVLGAQMQHHWLHCAAAPMQNYPTAPERATKEEWAVHCAKVDEFQRKWALQRKETGLGTSLTSKWVCHAIAGNKCGCWARGEENVALAIDLGLPVITPPDDWKTRACCTKKAIDFTPDPTKPEHQRKLAQRYYFGGTKWRRAYKRRALVEGTFGILKSASRQRLRRGQNRLPGLAMAHIVAGLKIALYNEEQLRLWHDRTGLGPVDHPLLQPDPPYWGFRDLTKAEAKAIDAEHVHRIRAADAEAA